MYVPHCSIFQKISTTCNLQHIRVRNHSEACVWLWALSHILPDALEQGLEGYYAFAEPQQQSSTLMNAMLYRSLGLIFVCRPISSFCLVRFSACALSPPVCSLLRMYCGTHDLCYVCTYWFYQNVTKYLYFLVLKIKYYLYRSWWFIFLTQPLCAVPIKVCYNWAVWQ